MNPKRKDFILTSFVENSVYRTLLRCGSKDTVEKFINVPTIFPNDINTLFMLVCIVFPHVIPG